MLASRIILLASVVGFSSGAATQHLTEGAAQSPVRVIIYEDLACPDCATFRKMMDDQILPKYADKVAFEHRDFPLAKHPWARKAAIAARFFGTRSPEMDLAFRRYAMTNLRQITVNNFEAWLTRFALAHQFDPAKALAALDDKQLGALVESDSQDGIARGIARTPTALVNGTPFIESFSFEDIAKSIEAELAAVNR
jgi:protein-disulfide isomerase